jgi:hypothetical protein
MAWYVAPSFVCGSVQGVSDQRSEWERRTKVIKEVRNWKIINYANFTQDFFGRQAGKKTSEMRKLFFY